MPCILFQPIKEKRQKHITTTSTNYIFDTIVLEKIVAASGQKKSGTFSFDADRMTDIISIV